MKHARRSSNHVLGACINHLQIKTNIEKQFDLIIRNTKKAQLVNNGTDLTAPTISYINTSKYRNLPIKAFGITS